jgi:hypothetical protein
VPLATAANPELQFRDRGSEIGAFPPEFDLLLCCARTTLDVATSARLRALVAGEIDWPNFVSLAVAHGVVPLVYQSLKSACWNMVPEAQQKQVRDYVLANAQSALRLTAELLRLLELFEARHIPVIPFKGPALAASVYGSPAMRQFGDLDLLVHERDVKKAKELLIAEGYRCQFNLTEWQEAAFIRYECEYAFTAKAGTANSRPAGIGCLSPLSPSAESTRTAEPPAPRPMVEIHWRLAPRHFRYPFDAAAIWQRAVPVTVAGRPMLSFHPEDLLLFLCLHGAKHLWSQLKWICDIAKLIRQHPDLDWDGLQTRSRRLGCERILLLGLHLANDLLGAKPAWGRIPSCGRFPIGPSQNQPKSSRDVAIRNLAAEVCLRLATPGAAPPGTFASLSFHLKARERLFDRLHHAVLILTTPTVADWESLRLPCALFPLYYLSHPFRMIRKHGGRV